MNQKDKTPVMVYDNQCYVCIKFAKIISFFSKGKIMIIGHYSAMGQTIREDLLDESALKMFWFIDWKSAYGGRAALLPMIKTIIFSKNQHSHLMNTNEMCGEKCNAVSAVFFRSVSLLSNSKKINLSKSK